MLLKFLSHSVAYYEENSVKKRKNTDGTSRNTEGGKQNGFVSIFTEFFS